jgi:hypothetical protein
LREALTQAGHASRRDVITLALGAPANVSPPHRRHRRRHAARRAYVEKAEKLGLVPIIYFGDVVHTRLGGFGSRWTR